MHFLQKQSHYFSNDPRIAYILVSYEQVQLYPLDDFISRSFIMEHRVNTLFYSMISVLSLVYLLQQYTLSLIKLVRVHIRVYSYKY